MSRNGSHFTGISTDEITPLEIDEGNLYFDMPPPWDHPFSRSQVNREPLSIDPSLNTMAGPPAPTTSSRTIVTVPEEFAEASSKILVYFARVLDIPEISKELDDGFIKEVAITTEELEAVLPTSRAAILGHQAEPSRAYIPARLDGLGQM